MMFYNLFTKINKIKSSRINDDHANIIINSILKWETAVFMMEPKLADYYSKFMAQITMVQHLIPCHLFREIMDEVYYIHQDHGYYYQFSI